jgi:hypothetical protein
MKKVEQSNELVELSVLAQDDSAFTPAAFRPNTVLRAKTVVRAPLKEVAAFLHFYDSEYARGASEASAAAATMVGEAGSMELSQLARGSREEVLREVLSPLVLRVARGSAARGAVVACSREEVLRVVMSPLDRPRKCCARSCRRSLARGSAKCVTGAARSRCHRSAWCCMSPHYPP